MADVRRFSMIAIVNLIVLVGVFVLAYRPAQAGIEYQNDEMGFEVRLPPSWLGFRTTEVTTSGYRYVAFTYGDPSGLRAEFSVIRVNNLNAELPPGSRSLTGDGTFFSAISPTETDSVIRARLAEIPEILSTFRRIGSKL